MRFLVLALRTLRVHRGVFGTLAVLIAATAFLAAAAPRALNAVYDDAIRDTIVAASPVTKDVQIGARPSGQAPPGQLATASRIERARDEWLASMPAGLRSEIGATSYVARTGDFPFSGQLVGEPAVGFRFLSFQHRSDLEAQVRFIVGGLPATPVETVIYDDVEIPQYGVALSTVNAAALQVELGDAIVLLDTRGAEPIPVLAAEVSGIYEPVDATSSYWAIDDSPLTRRVDEFDDRPPDLFGVAMLSAPVYDEWFVQLGGSVQATFRYEPDPAAIVAPDVARMQAGLDEFASDVPIASRFGITYRLDTSLGRLLDDFAERARTTSAVLSLGLAGLLAVALIVVALAGQLATTRRRDSHLLVRARGGSLRQLVGLVTVEMAVIAAPAAIAGYLVAETVVPARAAPDSVRLSLLVAVLAVVIVAGFAGYAHRRVSRQDRRDLIAVRPTSRRLVFEGLVVFLAALGVVLLHQRGLTTAVTELGTDPFLVAVPALLGFAAGLIALRAYPYPLRTLAQLTRRRRGAVGFIGVARASRAATASALPIVVLLLALALAVFGSVLDRALAHAQDLESWDEVGAEVYAQRDNLEEAELAAVVQVPGVTGVVAGYVDLRGELIAGDALRGQTIVMAVDLDAYGELVAGTPVAAPVGDLSAAGTDRLPALVSPEVELELASGPLSIRWHGVNARGITIAGTIEEFPGLRTRTPIVLVPYDEWAQSRGARPPNTLWLIGSDIDTADVAAALGGAGTTLLIENRTERLAEISESPLVEGVRQSFAVGVLALAGFGALAVLLALVIGSAARGRTVSQLRTLGLSQRQARRMQLLEVGPMVGAALVGGITLGVMLPRLVAPAVDLRPFAAGRAVDRYPVDLVAIGVLSVGLIAIVTVAVGVDAWINRRRGLGSVLRVGE